MRVCVCKCVCWLRSLFCAGEAMSSEWPEIACSAKSTMANYILAAVQQVARKDDIKTN